MFVFVWLRCFPRSDFVRAFKTQSRQFSKTTKMFRRHIITFRSEKRTSRDSCDWTIFFISVPGTYYTIRFKRVSVVTIVSISIDPDGVRNERIRRRNCIHHRCIEFTRRFAVSTTIHPLTYFHDRRITPSSCSRVVFIAYLHELQCKRYNDPNNSDRCERFLLPVFFGRRVRIRVCVCVCVRESRIALYNVT